MSRKKPVNYINNKDFYNALVEYKKECNQAVKEYQELIVKLKMEDPSRTEFPIMLYPRLSDYIGKAVLLLANKVMNMLNFIGYSYRDEMINDAIEDCILRIKSFDPDKSTNPFAYFTSTCYYAAVRRIKKEKKQKEIKMGLLKNSSILDDLKFSKQSGDDVEYHNAYISFLQENMGEQQKAEDASKPVYKRVTKAHMKRLKERAQQIEDDIKTMNVAADAPSIAEENEIDSVEEIEDIQFFDEGSDE